MYPPFCERDSEGVPIASPRYPCQRYAYAPVGHELPMSLAYPDRVGPLSTCPGKSRSGNSEALGACSLTSKHQNWCYLNSVQLYYSSTRVRKIPSTYPDCNSHRIYPDCNTTAAQPLMANVYNIPLAEQENYNRPGERSF